MSGVVRDESYHIGNFLMDYFINNPEDRVWQIDAGTGQSELKSSVKRRSVQLAKCIRNAGFVPGDIIAVSGKNHLDIHIPFYAAYFNGHPITGIDPFYKYDEIKIPFEIIKPTLLFCETYNVTEYEKVIKDLGLDTKIVTFGESDRSLAKFIKKYDDDTPESDFKVATFDTHKIYAWLASTSGTTGLPKVAAFKHEEILKVMELCLLMKQEFYNQRDYVKDPIIFSGIAPALNLSSVLWISSYFATLCMASANHVKVQTSAPESVEHVVDMINKYKPVISTSSPLMFNNILKHEKPCDFTCFNKIVLSGFRTPPATIQKLRAKMRPDAVIWNLFGQTETLGGMLVPVEHGPHGNVGVEVPSVPVQLVDTNTGEVITEPNKVGELWTKGPKLTEYYKNPEATAAAFSSDGWFKTGDLLYRDEKGFFFFVDRMSSAYRFRNSYVMPLQLEQVILEHPDVVDVCVVGIPHPDDINTTVAVVQRRTGSAVTDQCLKDHVAEKLSFLKHLHGGVIFVEDFPRTVNGKIAIAKVRQFVIEVRKGVSNRPENSEKLIDDLHELNIGNEQRLSTGVH